MIFYVLHGFAPKKRMKSTFTLSNYRDDSTHQITLQIGCFFASAFHIIVSHDDVLQVVEFVCNTIPSLRFRCSPTDANNAHSLSCVGVSECGISLHDSRGCIPLLFSVCSQAIHPLGNLTQIIFFISSSNKRNHLHKQFLLKSIF